MLVNKVSKRKLNFLPKINDCLYLFPVEENLS